MKEPRKNRVRIPRVLAQPSNKIAGYQEKSLIEQTELFAELIQTNGGKAVRRLWPKLDPDARWWVMEQLGCFAGPDSPQCHYLPRFEEGRAVIGLVSQQIRTLKKFIVAVERSVSALRDVRYAFNEYGRLIHALSLTIEKLERVKAVSSKHFGGPHDREVSSIIEAQEFVWRRTKFLGTKITLSPAAVADIFELNERGLKEPSSKDIAGRVQKALVRFRRGSDYDRYMDEMEKLIPEWRLPDPRREADIRTHEMNC